MSKEKAMQELVIEWAGGVEEVAHIESMLELACKRRDDAAQALAEAIVPDDMQLGETISVWVRFGHRDERLVTVLLEDQLPRVKGDPARVFHVAYRGNPRSER